ncbi:MAG: carbon-nitrogen hydrolase family protein [Pseudomonadota bacterium]
MTVVEKAADKFAVGVTSGGDFVSPKQTVRVASVQLALTPAVSVDELITRIAHHVKTASDYACDFICFPEHVTLQILADRIDRGAEQSITNLAAQTAIWYGALSSLAKDHSINIIGGSHVDVRPSSERRNVCIFAHRDGRIETRDKVHPTPDERDVWKLEGGDDVSPIQTDCGPIGILICYDSEFPELSRWLVDQAPIDILFVPYLTDTRAGHFRVRYCCHARTIENQHYVVTSGMVGNIERVTNLEMAYAQSAILTPNDAGFARDGIAAEAEPQIEQMIFADLDPRALRTARESGAVRNLADRRKDLYDVSWKR